MQKRCNARVLHSLLRRRRPEQSDLLLFKGRYRLFKKYEAFKILAAVFPKPYRLIKADFDISRLFEPYKDANAIRDTGIHIETYLEKERSGYRRRYEVYATADGLLLVFDDPGYPEHNEPLVLDADQRENFAKLMALLTRLSE